MKNKVSLFLDSGAYSAWSKKTTIPLQEYIDFVHKYKDYLEVYANLDDIDSPEKTWENQKEMERQGLSPLPVYHIGEDEKYLRRALEYEYFGVGGMALSVSSVRTRFYELIFQEICPKSNNYLPTHKIHGFGMTSLRHIIRFPWYSIDSTSWVMTSRFGSVYIPKIDKNGEYIYNADSWKVCVSSRSPVLTKDGKHFKTLPLPYQKIIKQYFKEKGYSLGLSRFIKRNAKEYTLEENEVWASKPDKKGFRMVERVIERGLSNDYKLRDEMNIIYFLDLEKSIPKWPWPFKKATMARFGMKEYKL